MIQYGLLLYLLPCQRGRPHGPAATAPAVPIRRQRRQLRTMKHMKCHYSKSYLETADTVVWVRVKQTLLFITGNIFQKLHLALD